MRRLRDVRLPPLAWVAIIAAVTALLRLVVAVQVRTPLYYPDEYLTAALSRAFGEGEFGQVRGGSLSASYTAYFVPLLHAPLWLIDDVEVPYRLAQGLGVIAFSAAAFPAYALARVLGLSEKGGLVVALLALLLPAGGFTTTLLGEPYAYPLFLLASLVAVDAIARPTVATHVAAIGLSGALCLVGGLQFVFFGVAYAAAWFVAGAWSRGALLRRVVTVCATVGAGVAALYWSGRDIGVLSSAAGSQQYPPGDIGAWLGVNAFVLALAAGWLVVPGGLLGLGLLSRQPAPRQRAFAFLAAFVIVGTLLEAALWSANGHGVYERFTFYGAPLLALGFVWLAESPQRRRGVYAALAYGIAAIALLLPTTDALLVADDDHSPALLGLSLLTFGDRVGPLFWAPALALLLVAAAWRGVTSPMAVAIVAASFAALLSVGSSVEYVRRTHDPLPPPRIATPPGSAILTWEGSNRIFLEETLFWNREITRVVVLEPGGPPDGLGYVLARPQPGGRLTDGSGTPVPGPFVLGPDVTPGRIGQSGTTQERLVVMPDIPPVLVFGGHRAGGYLGFAGRIFLSSGESPFRATLQLTSADGDRTIAIRCDPDIYRRLSVGARPISVPVPVGRASVRLCRYGLAIGGVRGLDGFRITARLRVGVEPS